jgi:lysozyme family protein
MTDASSLIDIGRDTIIGEVLQREGGYSNNPDDSGGPTRWGVTQREARLNGYHGDMRDFPQEMAIKIYRDKYWDKLHLDDIWLIDRGVAGKVFDIGVNLGLYQAARFLQRGLNVLNQKGTVYGDLVVDGLIGPATINALRRYIKYRAKVGGVIMVKLLNVLQGAYYVELAERREKDETFVFGWLRTRIA